jgi:DNA-binding IclR family transcriptional regulator
LSETESKSSIQVIDRMMKLLDVLSSHTDAVSLKQLAHLTGLHPSSAHRILNVMVEKRLVERAEAGSYRLGIKLLELGNLVKSRMNVRQIALPFMQRLHDELGETVNLIVRQGDEVVYVERTSGGKSMMRVVQIVGARAPLHITAVGKVFMAQDGKQACIDYAKRTGLPAFTKNTITAPDKLLKELEQISQKGVAYDNEEAERGVSCIGAGIRNSEGRIVAGLSVSAPSERVQKSWASRIRQTADEISLALGYMKA